MAGLEKSLGVAEYCGVTDGSYERIRYMSWKL